MDGIWASLVFVILCLLVYMNYFHQLFVYLDGGSDACLRPLLVNSIIEKKIFF